MRLPRSLIPQYVAVPFKSVRTGEPYDCLDGLLTSTDIALAAGCSPKEVRRALDQAAKQDDAVRSAPTGALVDFDGGELPPPGEATRAAVAEVVAKRFRLGRFRIAAQIRDRQEERAMGSQQHPWNTGKHGRSVKQYASGIVATLRCERCPAALTVRFRQLCDSAEMDRKFKQKGWRLDPARCPDCQRHRKGTNVEATAKPSAAAIQGQARMYRLLTENFDVEAGAYRAGYSDRKIADECRLSVELVEAIRKEAFGDLKEPPEIAAIRADIDALDALLTEQTSTIGNELAKLRTRMAELSKRFGG